MLCKHASLKNIENRNYSAELLSHWRCCLVGVYRKTLKSFKNYPTNRQKLN